MAARMSVGERRARLVEAAIAVMAREGVAGATTRAIVAEAGMHVGAFHYCFRAKDELVLEVMRTLNERSFTAVAEVLGRSRDAAELVRLAIDTYWRHVTEHPLEHLLTYELTEWALRQPDGAVAARQQYAGYTAGLEQFLAAAARTASFTWRVPVAQLARYVLAVVEGLTFQWLVTRDDDHARELLASLTEHLYAEAGLTAEAREARPA